MIAQKHAYLRLGQRTNLPKEVMDYIYESIIFGHYQKREKAQFNRLKYEVKVQGQTLEVIFDVFQQRIITVIRIF